MKRNEIREAIRSLGVYFLESRDTVLEAAGKTQDPEERGRYLGSAASFELASGLLRALWGEIPADERPASEPTPRTYSAGGYL